MNRALILIITATLLCVAVNMPTVAQERFRIMEYNVENLFDTIPNPSCDDSEFSPQGARKWNAQRYWAKQGRLARVIAAAGGESPVEIIGLIEVENDTVLSHLTRRTSLARLGYDYIITDGPDVRGIDVALLYQPGRFRPLTTISLPVPTCEGQRPMRDVLFVEGLLPSLDTLSIFVAHFPSRRGGVRETAAHRCQAAQVIRHKVDSIQQKRSDALIVVMGDMNDESEDASIKDVLKVIPAVEGKCTETALYDLPPRCEEHAEITGTYYYQHEWSMIDHIIVSGAVVHTHSPLQLTAPSSRILAFPFLLKHNQKEFPGRYIPNRNYAGNFYNGGFSDHLPMLVEFLLEF